MFDGFVGDLTILACYFLSGQSPAEADLNLLETARRCELYGVKMHPAKVSCQYFSDDVYVGAIFFISGEKGS